MLQQKAHVLISSCLAGALVRYDGKPQALGNVLKQLEEQYQLISVCPEVAIGLGMPRPPLHIRQYNGAEHAVLIEDPSVDYTLELRTYAQQVLEQYPNLSGCILKQKSPSCGTGRTKVHNVSGELIAINSWGIFARELQRLRPELIFISEDNLSPVLQDVYISPLK